MIARTPMMQNRAMQYTSFDEPRRWLSPQLTRTTLLIVAAVWLSIIPNLATLKMFYAASAGASPAAGAVFMFGGWVTLVAVLLLFLLLLSAVFLGQSLRYFLIVAVITAASLSYFTLFFGTWFDKTMLLNLLQTHASESIELVNPKLIAWVLLVGVLPALWIWRVNVVPERSHLRGVARPVLWTVGLLLLAALLVFSQFSRYASAGRNRAITFHTVAPINIVAAGVTHVGTQQMAARVREPVGTDARSRYALEKPRLVVFLVGETTRAQNWGLNGYERETTPRLRGLDVLNFPDVSSCGTATAISLPCMFSGLTREEFSLSKAAGRETLIDVISHSGARVFWWDNDGGCKGVCDRIEHLDLNNSSNPKYCSELGECVDEILLDGLEQKIATDTRDTLVVLHLKGSHGPAYYKRYPPAFEKFSPVCKSSDLSSCTSAELRNAYDNTIVYADHMAAETIALLKRLDSKFATAMFYVSDHGESLGESGLYLHGMPYAIAPKEQTRVPMVAWLSEQFVTMEGFDRACLKTRTPLPYSHDHVYSTILGMLEIETHEYSKALDIFAACDSPKPSTPSAVKK